MPDADTRHATSEGLRSEGHVKNGTPTWPLVSVVTVVYNGEKYLQDTIKSVTNQDYSDFEYLIVDGGSTDSTLRIIQAYESKINYWISEPDKGISDALNKGASLASGEYILFLHADDQLFSSKALTQLVEAVKPSQKQWAMGFYKYLNSDSQIIKQDPLRSYCYRDMMLRNIIRHQATLIPQSAFDSLQFDTRFKYAMDYMFFLKLWNLLGPPEFLKNYIAYFRLDGNSLSSNYYASIADEMYARRIFRRENGEHYMLPLDYCIYIFRLLKIFLYHSRKKLAR